jgi:hypothetical protein
MAVNLSPIGGVAAQFFDNSGNVLSGGKIFTYAAGTTTPLPTYTSAAGTTPLANPIILDAAGRVPTGEIWLTDGLQYKFIIKTSTDVQIGSYDNIVGINSNFVNYTNSQEIQTATAGQTVFTLTTMAYQPGTGSLSVFVDGVNQYGPGATYAYTETGSTIVTFNAGLHVGASVKFVSSQLNSAASTANASQIPYTPPFAGGVVTNVAAKLAQTVSILDFGASTGGTAATNTTAIQAAVTYAETIGADVIFPPGTYNLKQIFVTTGNIRLVGQSATLVQYHDDVNSIIVGGPGEYKVSAAFFTKRGCANVEITGFTFTTNNASFPALAVGFGSYFPSIGGQHSDNVYIHHNNFQGGQDRCMFFQAGKNLRFENNNIENNGFTVHIGYEGNLYFYDATTDTSIKYSPIAPSFVNNVFDGYSSDRSTVCAHLTGCVEFVFRDNRLLNMAIGSIGSLRVLRLYSNDFGPYDENGNQLAYIQGVCSGNVINGTFTYALEIDGNSTLASSTWTSSFQMRILVEGNNIQGTGSGIKTDEVQDTKIVGNFVDVTESPLYIENRLAYVTVDNNTFRSTAGGYNDTAIYTGYTAGSGYWTFTNNRVVVSTLSQYIFNSSAAMTWFVCSENNFYFDGDVAGSRPFVLTLAGKSWFKDNVVNVQTDVTNAFVCLFTGSGTSASLNFEGNQIVSGGAGAATLRCINAVSFVDVNIHKNTFVGAILVEDCDRAFITNNTLLLPASNSITCIDCDNSGYAVKALVEVHSNYVLQPSALNAACIRIVSNNDATNNTLSKVTMNYLSGNSTGSLLQQTVYGELGIIGNTIVNAGTGGTTPTVTGSATLVNF